MRKSVKKKFIRKIKNQYPSLNFKQRLSLLAYMTKVEQGEFFPSSTLAKAGEALARQMEIFDLQLKPCGCGDPQCVIQIPCGDLVDLYNEVI